MYARSYAKECMDKAAQAHMPLEKVAIGVPFYGRIPGTGEWRSYEDMVQQNPQAALVDQVGLKACGCVE